MLRLKKCKGIKVTRSSINTSKEIFSLSNKRIYSRIFMKDFNQIKLKKIVFGFGYPNLVNLDMIEVNIFNTILNCRSNRNYSLYERVRHQIF